MSTITPRIDHDYCSQMRVPLPPFRTIEEGVKTIQTILAKEVLCRHDVDDINRIYREVDLLERQVDRIPEPNSLHALESIVSKVKKNNNLQSISAKDLISLYHLQKFSGERLPVDECFKSLSNNPRIILKANDIATHLPFCISNARFNEDAESLIGRNPTDEVNEILNQKRAGLQKHEIACKKLELKELIKNDPQKYPAYLDELLDNGYIHLYDHLVTMRPLSEKELQSFIKNIPFSTLSHVVLEVREAIIQKVERSIPPDRCNILFILGGTRSGKSTTLCYLRGDKMVFNGSNYESKSGDRLIGHSETTSCTFLPTIEIVNGLVIADFPGFHDTNGQVVSLGMEFALTALIEKYNPKILVLEEITNKACGYESAKSLGSRLDRLLENKEDCVLGITKYSQDDDVKEIRNIEEKQREMRSALASPTQEEIKLSGSITSLSASHEAVVKTHNTLSGSHTFLSNLKVPDSDPHMQNLKSQMQDFESQMQRYTSQIDQKQKQLTKIQQERLQQFNQPLPGTNEKEQRRNKIAQREIEFLSKTGLETFIGFSDLEDPKLLSKCFATFAEMKPIRVKSAPHLDSNDKDLLDQRFVQDLVREIESKKDYYNKFKNVEDFFDSVSKSSLINVILQSNSEIGRFLHLPEIDPLIVRDYDKRIVSSCIKKYTDAAVKTINKSYINIVLKEPRLKAGIVELEKKWIMLQNYIMGLSGIGPLSEDPQKAEELWDTNFRQKNLIIEAKATVDYLLSSWVLVFLLPFGIEYICYQMENAMDIPKKALDKQIIDGCCSELDTMRKTLMTLKDLEKIIEKQDAIDKAFNSPPISLNSMQDLRGSIENKLYEVKLIYQSKEITPVHENKEQDKHDSEWGKQVSLLKESLSFIHPLPPHVRDCLIGVISSLFDHSIRPISLTISNTFYDKLEITSIRTLTQQLIFTAKRPGRHGDKTGLTKFIEPLEAILGIGTPVEFIEPLEAILGIGTPLEFIEPLEAILGIGTPLELEAQKRVNKIMEHLLENGVPKMKKEVYGEHGIKACMISSLQVTDWASFEKILNSKMLAPHVTKFARDRLKMNLEKPLFRAMLADVLLSHVKNWEE